MMRWRQFAHNILFLEAFQCTETNGSNGIDETDLVFLTGILSHPSVTQKFKVSRFIDPLSIDTTGKLFFFYKIVFFKLEIAESGIWPFVGYITTIVNHFHERQRSAKPVSHFTFVELQRFHNENERVTEKNWRPYSKKVKQYNAILLVV